MSRARVPQTALVFLFEGITSPHHLRTKPNRDHLYKVECVHQKYFVISDSSICSIIVFLGLDHT
jgi:hypothetical protein